MFACCDCCMLLGRGLYDELITRLEGSCCCICRLVTNNLCVSTWTGSEEYCRAEAMGVILGVVYSTIAEMKQRNLLS